MSPRPSTASRATTALGGMSVAGLALLLGYALPVEPR